MFILFIFFIISDTDTVNKRRLHLHLDRIMILVLDKNRIHTAISYPDSTLEKEINLLLIDFSLIYDIS